MKFGPIPLGQAEGAIVAHSVRLARGSIRKGTRLTVEHIEKLAGEGHTAVIAALLEPLRYRKRGAAQLSAGPLGGRVSRFV